MSKEVMFERLFPDDEPQAYERGKQKLRQWHKYCAEQRKARREEERKQKASIARAVKNLETALFIKPPCPHRSKDGMCMAECAFTPGDLACECSAACAAEKTAGCRACAKHEVEIEEC